VSFSVKLNTDDFLRGLKRAMERNTNEGMRRMAKELQSVFDSVLASHRGQPIEEVKPALAAACRRHDFKPDDKDLTTYAAAISEGRRIVLQPQRVRL
jgi:hypothetical protein